MNATPDELTIECRDATGMYLQKDELLAVYREVYAERLNNPFFYPDRFWQRLESYASRDGFRLVTAHVDGKLVGFTLGEPLSANTGWWRGFTGDIDPDLLRETGTRTFGINELQVRPSWRRRGYATVLSNALLEDRPEERATLLVRAENLPAYTAYQSWGFRVIGQVQPFDDSPLYEAMMKELGGSGA
ncbi:MAG: GNAT family N-acetyltransferase [Labedaea sp.]